MKGTIIELTTEELKDFIVRAVKDAAHTEVSQAVEQLREESYLTIREVSEMMKVFVPTIIRWMDDGKLTRLKSGSIVRLKESEVRSILKPL